MKVLLTGASGMVGRNIQSSGLFHDCDLLIPNSTELNLLDENATHSYFADQKPEFVIHAAAMVGGIQANIKRPVDFLVNNFEINKNVMLAACRAGSNKVLYLGSSCMYPRNVANPLKEEMILKGELEPTNEGYAIAKIMGQKLGQYLHYESPEFVTKTLIPPNLYGLYDSFSPEKSHLIPAIIYKLHQARIENLSAVEIWGDGSARREFMFASDLAECIFRAVKDFNSLPISMNVGLGHDYSVKEYYQVAADVMGYSGEFTFDTSKPVGMKQKLLDVTQMQKWGWKPKTNLREGLSKAYQYFLSLQKE